MAQKTTPGSFYWPSPDGENANSMVIPKEYAYKNKPICLLICQLVFIAFHAYKMVWLTKPKEL